MTTAESGPQISHELLDILACPICHGELVEVQKSTALDCPKDRLRFPVREGIPILMVEEAEAR